ncbi:hypothetical protein [Rhizobium leguminosarum]|uniref:hypothetical protein n=1 Tax=Rhizobium leguminosarum TaxID=384 RepID=UPI00143F4C1F|nr:hypothetical protein [Rhizobium leguminosarum]NKL24851.1 hypothetical protein [Rhizobium leguminosarum bv. viciae]
MKRAVLLIMIPVLAACDQQKNKSPDLADQPDKWMTTISLQGDSKPNHVGKTTVIGSTTIKPLSGLQTITVGDEIDGIHIGAIKCAFFNKDASYAGEQFMWRGRWGCLAGRSQDEVSTAVQEDGTKLYDYIHVAPIALDAQ